MLPGQNPKVVANPKEMFLYVKSWAGEATTEGGLWRQVRQFVPGIPLKTAKNPTLTITASRLTITRDNGSQKVE